jgi:hypothetical protein
LRDGNRLVTWIVSNSRKESLRKGLMNFPLYGQRERERERERGSLV